MYFAFDGKPPISGPILLLNGENRLDANSFTASNHQAIINNMCFPSEVSSSYAPNGKSLAVVTMVGVRKESDQQLEALIRKELQQDWFPTVDINSWKMLKAYRIPYAQPAQDGEYTSTKLVDNIFIAGDHTESPTVHGAVKSGRIIAEELIQSLK